MKCGFCKSERVALEIVEMTILDRRRSLTIVTCGECEAILGFLPN